MWIKCFLLKEILKSLTHKFDLFESKVFTDAAKDLKTRTSKFQMGSISMESDHIKDRRQKMRTTQERKVM